MVKNVHQYYVYISTHQKNGTLYIGMTNDLEQRIIEHREKIIKGFTKKYGLNKLIYLEEFQNVNNAILREKRI